MPHSSRLITILGAAESGVGAAILAKQQGYEVFISDCGRVKDKYKSALAKHGITWEEGTHTETRILKAAEIIKSPGIPENSPIMKAIRRKKIPVISEIEFAYRFTDAKIIAITGSNGKSTTTSLTYHIFKKAGLNVGLAGNIGYSFARQVAEQKHDYYVLEISNFQLDDIVHFKPHVSVLLNITPDHLDRYEYNFESYIRSKFRIAENQTKEDYFIYCADDEVVTSHLKKNPVKATLLPFTLKKKPGSVGYTVSKKLFVNHKNPFKMQISDLSLVGTHNTYNSLAACLAAKTFDIRNEVIRESLADFKGLDHRLEFVSKIGGVEYINDSKATNVNSTWYALESMTKPVIWIVGGVDKGNDYSVLVDLVKKKVKAIVCLGADNLRIHEAFSKHVDLIVNTMSAKESVKIAHYLADKGDVVLLSPCCASFDLFENYEDRGNQFKEAVRNL
ncbi:MAG TPA: UDP-N-acetylmuramoyl-L-alanine--D-glutamate ligase [Chitinophagales bacterium]|nr:UDP-N-acetylmuramoyl-L-alanine--D-glutamate ligase [Chitinophagales bacterium]